ncbi:uncharacterized protein LOC129600912 [Paramacrobiotus metropolitanus]|uniref:uncharacterized protein LOC129600912 n=1 Tax=Paramacrobiotus metropolitanus TaxID=2943436 RepID=UPI00244601CF|nr:uncharacterized protein LOC129600912 [Paramacrobiotus metropolitanus]
MSLTWNLLVFFLAAYMAKTSDGLTCYVCKSCYGGLECPEAVSEQNINACPNFADKTDQTFMPWTQFECKSQNTVPRCFRKYRIVNNPWTDTFGPLERDPRESSTYGCENPGRNCTTVMVPDKFEAKTQADVDRIFRCDACTSNLCNTVPFVEGRKEAQEEAARWKNGQFATTQALPVPPTGAVTVPLDATDQSAGNNSTVLGDPDLSGNCQQGNTHALFQLIMLTFCISVLPGF